jgi:hypothetical protein
MTDYSEAMVHLVRIYLMFDELKQYISSPCPSSEAISDFSVAEIVHFLSRKIS